MEWFIIIAIIVFIFRAINSAGEQKEKEKEAEVQSDRQRAAEEYILNSGDEEAIKQLMLMRANPVNYKSRFATAASSGNDTMRTAFAVMAGFIAADLITTSMHTAALEEALSQASSEIDKALSEFDFTGSDDFADGSDLENSGIGGDEVGEDPGDIFDNLFS